ncbi:hypothetical protein AXX17_AT3G00070 [Arabidopsis thaliana]|uniref:Uncharacterized protein n=1 Tax=Arabidopsis thaliana TaxID=3702 RepID=A0A178VCI2_ARATH|nr:hypothetical protein AXX17_AT3G00070 [Arabidopsis thaliana]
MSVDKIFKTLQGKVVPLVISFLDQSSHQLKEIHTKRFQQQEPATTSRQTTTLVSGESQHQVLYFCKRCLDPPERTTHNYYCVCWIPPWERRESAMESDFGQGRSLSKQSATTDLARLRDIKLNRLKTHRSNWLWKTRGRFELRSKKKLLDSAARYLFGVE